MCRAGEDVQKFTEEVVGAVGDVTQWGVQNVAGFAVGIFEGLRKAWGDVISDKQREAVNSVVLFSRSAPPQLVKAVDMFMKERGIKDPSTVRALTDLGAWMNVMATSDIFAQPATPKGVMASLGDPTAAMNLLDNSPKSLFLSLEPQARQELYMALMGSVIPERYRREAQAVSQGTVDVPESGYVTMAIKDGETVRLSSTGEVLGDRPGEDILENNVVRVTRIDSGHILIETKEVQAAGARSNLLIGPKGEDINVMNVNKVLNEGGKMVIPGSQKQGKNKADTVVVRIPEANPAVFTEEKFELIDGAVALGPIGAADKFPLKFNRDANGNIEVYAQEVTKDTYAKFSINGVPHLILVRESRPNKPLQDDFPGEGSPEFLRQQRIMQLVLGVKQPAELKASPEEVAAARASLLQTYPPRDDQKNTSNPNQLEMQQVLTMKLVQDYKEAVQYIGTSVPIGTTSQPSALAERLPACTFKGALNLGVVDQKTLAVLGRRLADVQRNRVHALDEASKNWNDRTQESRRKHELEAKTLGDTWSEMSGTMKLTALVGLGAFAWNFRRTSLALTIGYFGFTFLTKDNDLLGTIDKRVSKWFGGLMNENDKALKELDLSPNQPYDIKQTSQRMDMLVNFLSESDRGNLGKQAEGLLYLSTVPLDDLARNFEVSSSGVFNLRTEPNGEVQRAIRKNLQARGLRSDIDPFFKDEKCKTDVNDAMMYTFFMIAKRQNPADPRIRTVVDAMNNLGAGTTYAQLQSKDPVAYQTLVDVIMSGKRVALNSKMLLAEFIQTIKPTAPSSQ